MLFLIDGCEINRENFQNGQTETESVLSPCKAVELEVYSVNPFILKKERARTTLPRPPGSACLCPGLQDERLTSHLLQWPNFFFWRRL